ncbi:hypothetical protein [Planotetraspora phitsanulokensis]|uniref:Uncharacterized protein n=1 Tax=Planotetraspora phitsanulokensis TaxID=575192 RepID=A0A8J3XK61_9ACTN|nr:hypothetical protein [Planotetraspora phitsanulokensis]GII42786.1 hypothetical protein Pph01_77890 [Planotetraspora phitsanulokensis]
MRDDDLPGVPANERNRDLSEIAARDEFNGENAPLKGLALPCDLRRMDLPERPWRDIAPPRRPWHQRFNLTQSGMGVI